MISWTVDLCTYAGLNCARLVQLMLCYITICNKLMIIDELMCKQNCKTFGIESM